MRVEDLRELRIQDVAFGLLLASGLSVGYVFLLAFRNWVSPQGEGAFGIYFFGMLSLIPTGLAWLACGLQSFMGVIALEPGVFAASATYLALRWFWVWRRRRFAVEA